MDLDWSGYLAIAWQVVVFPVRLAWRPFSALINVALFLLEPLIQLAQAGLSVVYAIANFFAGLQVGLLQSHETFVGIGLLTSCCLAIV